MPKSPIALMAIAALLAACSAAAQDAGPLGQVPAEQALHGAPAAEAVYASASGEHAQAAQAGAAVSCDVRTRRSAGGLVLQARAFADRDVDGEYDLVITKSGGGNASEINQGGPLAIAAGSSVTLGESEISVERGARVHAVLTLRDADGVLCRRTITI